MTRPALLKRCNNRPATINLVYRASLWLRQKSAWRATRARAASATKKFEEAGGATGLQLTSRRAPKRNRSRRYGSVVRNKGTALDRRQVGDGAVSRCAYDESTAH